MQYVTPDKLSGLFKEVYGDEILNLLPDVALITKMVPFVERDKEEGNKYHQPVIVSDEHGVTYASASAGAFALNDHIAMTMQDAQIEGSQILLRSAISYDTAAKASSNKKAFVKAFQLVVENMLTSIVKKLELSMLYGGVGLGVADEASVINSTTAAITLTTASWASGIWVGSEGAQVQFYLLPNETLISSGSDSIFRISAIDTDNRSITVTGSSTGITALSTALAGAGQANIYFRGAKGNEMAGLDRIITNTGTLFNINAASWNIWRGNTYSAGNGALTMSKLLSANARAVDRGLNEKATLWVNPRTWSNLNSDLAALRKYDGSYNRKRLENGTEAISYYAQNGEIEVISHNCVKEGMAYLIPMKQVKRIGAQEVSFNTPGRGDEIFSQLPNNAGYELRVYTDQAIFLQTPSRAVKITNIVNS